MKWEDLEPYLRHAVIKKLEEERRIVMKATSSQTSTNYLNALRLAIEKLERNDHG